MKLTRLNNIYTVWFAAVTILAQCSIVAAQDQSEGRTYEVARITVLEAVTASNKTGRLRVRESDGIECVSCGDNLEFGSDTRLRIGHSGQFDDIRNLSKYTSGDVAVYVFKQGYVGEVVVLK